jgi:hypothetical protein
MSGCVTPRRPSVWTSSRCRPAKAKLRSYEEIVQHYIDRCRSDAREELRHFGSQPDLPTAIRFAALAINEKGKRHDHQRRIPRQTLEHFRRDLLKRCRALRSCKTFPELMMITEKVGAGYWKRPGLTVYDTTHRIGEFIGVHPDRVYLHTGTRDGAKALGLDGKRPFLFRREFPRAFGRLKPYEIEDCLCRYKDQLKVIFHSNRK